MSRNAKTENTARDAAAENQVNPADEITAETNVADEVTEENGRTVIRQAKLSAAYIGNPRKGAALNPGQSHIVGYISGIASGVKAELLPSGESSESLTGSFEGETADGKKIIRSGRLFLPRGIHEEVVTIVKAGKEAAFSLEIRTRPAKNPIGYEYEVHNVVEPKEDDAAKLRRKLIEDRRRKMLPHLRTITSTASNEPWRNDGS